MENVESVIHYCRDCLPSDVHKGVVEGTCCMCGEDCEVVAFHLRLPPNPDRAIKIVHDTYELVTREDGSIIATQRMSVPAAAIPRIIEYLEKE